MGRLNHTSQIGKRMKFNIKNKKLQVRWHENHQIMRNVGVTLYRQKSNDGDYVVRSFVLCLWKYAFLISLWDGDGVFAEAVNYKSK